MEDVRRRRGLGAVLGRDPVYDVLPGRVRGVLGRLGHGVGVARDVLRLLSHLG